MRLYEKSRVLHVHSKDEAQSESQVRKRGRQEEELAGRRRGGTHLSFVSFSNPSRWLILLS